jgi:hypothetical protein
MGGQISKELDLVEDNNERNEASLHTEIQSLRDTVKSLNLVLHTSNSTSTRQQERIRKLESQCMQAQLANDDIEQKYLSVQSSF